MRFRSILWNLFGLGLPLLIAAITVPGLIDRIGSERFGFLALAWGLIGYAGALDLGVGRAATQRIAAAIGGRDERQVPDILATAARITLCAGGAGFVLIVVAAFLGAYRGIPTESVPDREVMQAMLLLGLALPMQAITATYRGVNEAYLNFAGINVLRIALGVATFGGPYLVALYTGELQWLVATLVFSRAAALVLYRRLAKRRIAASLGNADGSWRREHAGSLLRFGGWFTVSSVVSPLLVQADRFVVGALISAAAVTIYVLPYEIAIQSLVVVGAVTSVAFPVITGLLHQDPKGAERVFARWTRRMAGTMCILMAALAAIMGPLLELWVGEHVSPESVVVGRILCFGVFLNSIGAMYFSLLHAQGRTRATALLHLAELPFYAALLYLLVTRYGVVGAAVAWTSRVAVDTLLLVLMASRLPAASRGAAQGLGDQTG